MTTFLLLIACGIVGGLLFFFLHIPGGAMLGAVVAVLAVKMLGHVETDTPHLFQLGAQIAIGVMVGNMMTGGTLLEIAVTTFVINIRYMLMSLSLSQKLDPDMKMAERLILSFGVTDEVFAVAIRQRKELTARYLAGLILTPYAGWALGTVLGATATGVLPLSVRSALGIAIYGMFIAIIIPPSREAKPVAITVVLAAALSCLFYYIPGLNQISSGWVIIICAVIAAGIMALRFPVDEETPPEEKEAA